MAVQSKSLCLSKAVLFALLVLSSALAVIVEAKKEEDEKNDKDDKDKDAPGEKDSIPAPSQRPSVRPTRLPTSLPTTAPVVQTWPSAPSSPTIPVQPPVMPPVNPTEMPAEKIDVTESPSSSPTVLAQPSPAPIKTAVTKAPVPVRRRRPTASPTTSTVVVTLPESSFSFLLVSTPSNDSLDLELLEWVFVDFMQEAFSDIDGALAFSASVNFDNSIGNATVTLGGKWTGRPEDAPTEATFNQIWITKVTEELLVEALNEAGFEVQGLTMQLNTFAAAESGSNTNAAAASSTSDRIDLDERLGSIVIAVAVVFLVVPWAVVAFIVTRKRIRAAKEPVMASDDENSGILQLTKSVVAEAISCG